MGARRKRRRGRSPLSVDVVRLELARGYDGFLRGAPEPAIATAVFLVMDGKVHLIGRSVARFEVEGAYPMALEPLQPASIQSRKPFHRGRLVVLCIALEEDAETAVQDLYARFEHADELSFWPKSEQVPDPVPLVELENHPARCANVGVFIGACGLEEFCSGDEVIGAHFQVLEPETVKEEHRVRVVSNDRKNDWTIILNLRIP